MTTPIAKLIVTEIVMETRRAMVPGHEYVYITGCCGGVTSNRRRAPHPPAKWVKCPCCGGRNGVDWWS